MLKNGGRKYQSMMFVMFENETGDRVVLSPDIMFNANAIHTFNIHSHHQYAKLFMLYITQL